MQAGQQGSLAVVASRGASQSVAGMPVVGPAVIGFRHIKLKCGSLSIGTVRPGGSCTKLHGMHKMVLIVIKAQLFSPGAETKWKPAGEPPGRTVKGSMKETYCVCVFRHNQVFTRINLQVAGEDKFVLLILAFQHPSGEVQG